MCSVTDDELGICVLEVRDQILEADPTAHRGLTLDAAAYKVAGATGVKAIDAVRAFRRFIPLPPSKQFRGPLPGARPPATEAVEAAQVPCAGRS